MNKQIQEGSLSKIALVLQIIGEKNRFYNPQKEYEHIVRTRITKSELLKEIKLMFVWRKNSIDRHNKLRDLINEIILEDTDLSEVIKKAKEINL